MKKIFRKTMLILSFLGLFTFAATKQAKAESGQGWPRQVWVCYPDGSCHCCLLENPSDYWIYYGINCEGQQVIVD